jgi:hypothetical protein
MLTEITRHALIREVHVGRAAREGDDPTDAVSEEKVATLKEKLSAKP